MKINKNKGIFYAKHFHKNTLTYMVALAYIRTLQCMHALTMVNNDSQNRKVIHSFFHLDDSAKGCEFYVCKIEKYFNFSKAPNY